MSIEGEWHGVYRYDEPGTESEECPFTAHFRCVSRSITGTFRDDRDVVSVIPYGPALEEAKVSMTAEQLANAGDFFTECADLHLRSELPLDATVTGEVLPPRVWFVKRYPGPEKLTWVLGKHEVVVKRDPSDHRVWYEGRLSPDGRLIEGKWKIRRPGLFGQWQKPITAGTFRMQKG